MSGHGDLESIILSVIERWIAGRYTERHALVTSYDPKTYLAKVTFQPEGQESGWIPIETGHIGQGYGIAVGLQPGSGSGIKGQQQGDAGQSGSDANGATGDQVIVRYQEGDIESGKIVQRVHSDKDKPPEVKSGEMVFWTVFKQDSNKGPDSADSGQPNSTGQQIWFKNDGSIFITDGNGANITMDGKGNITHTCKNYTQNISGDHSITVKGKQTVEIDKDKSVTIKGQRTDNVSKSWMATASSSLWGWLTSGSDISD